MIYVLWGFLSPNFDFTTFSYYLLGIKDFNNENIKNYNHNNYNNNNNNNC